MYTIQPKKLMIINILDILKKYTDEDHRLSQKDIVDILKKEYSMPADRKAVKSNLMNLVDFGYPINYSESLCKDKNGEDKTVLTDWYLSHDFSDAELRLLIDGLLFSRHIPYSQRKELITKLEGLSSVYFHSKVRHICTMPDDSSSNKQLHPRWNDNGEIRRYIVNPYQLAVMSGRYYFICNYDKYDMLSNYRVDRIAEISATIKHPEFTSLYHLINKEMLLQCHRELDGNKAVGIDDITKREYSENLERNIEDLVDRLKRKAYKPQPSLRVYIPKSNGKMRPLGIACYEDKIVQLALKKILEAIYEPKFLDCMHGFRPHKGCHTAVKELYQRLNGQSICRIVDADIKGFFDHMKHEWIIRFLNYYIKDKNILWLVKKYLKAGVLDQGKLIRSNEGTAQGNIISPVLANIYMHNVLTLWFQYIIARECRGQCFLIVYADDFIAGFEFPQEAERFYQKLKDRMERFGLELEESKSRLLESGRYLATAKAKRGESTRFPTFDFLGFTFYCGRSRKGKPWMMPKTSGKKFRRKIREMKEWLYANRDQKLEKLMYMVNVKLSGHYRYYGISFNSRMIANFRQQVRELLFKALNRRSQRKSYTRAGFIEMLKFYPLVNPRIYTSLFD